MEEPIKKLYGKFGVNLRNVKKVVYGDKYTAVVLKNGNIGLCANLNNRINIRLTDLESPDFNSFEHRIVLNAYYNAEFNNLNKYDKILDIFDGIDFTKYNNLVMIGYFKPLLKKFKKNNIKISIFDLFDRDEIIVPMEKQSEYVKKADAIILTSTSIFNNTFLDIVNNTSNCDIFLLGPSSIMHPEMLDYKNVKAIFGSVFEKNDEKVLNIIKDGFGTQYFLPYGKKVSLQ
ncbi:MAG: hypothetical protein DRJ01_03265 [Bacteroidetes bacterium]|nr:MAG: hypothetical protein DRJ01_03265 [Bacteroidota bacterium]